jgi:hypothetical protein
LKNTNIKVTDIKISKASKKATHDKMYITFILLHTLPRINGNGEAFHIEETKKAAKTVEEGFLNIKHIQGFNVGSVLEAEYKEDEQGTGYIECVGVLWKSSLKEFDINVQDILDGKFGVSMEVSYTDYYYLLDEERVERPQGEDYLKDYIGGMYEGKRVVRVIKPIEFRGGAITDTPADTGAVIKKAIAQLNNKGGKQMFKELQFETEKEYNQFLEEQRKGFVSVAEVLSSLPEDMEIESLAELNEKVNEIREDLKVSKAEFVEYKKEVLFKERKEALAELDIEVEDEAKEEIVSMSELAFDLIVKSNKSKVEKLKESKASLETKKEEKLDLSVQIEDEGTELSVEEIIDAL